MVEINITCKVWTIVRAFKNSKSEHEKNGRLVRLNDSLRTKSTEVILKMTILMTYLLNMNKGCLQNN